MARQPKHRVRYLEQRRLADAGRAYYYNPPADARAAGVVARAALGRDLNQAQKQAAEYNAAIDAWRRDQTLPDRQSPRHGTFAWAVERFREVRDYPTRRRNGPLKDKTKRDYDSYLDRLIALPLKKGGARLGEIPLGAIKVRHARRIYEIFGKAKEGDVDAHRSGLYAIQVCRRLWNLVAKVELELTTNPFSALDIGGGDEREVVWSYAQVMTFYETAKQNGLHSVGLVALLCYELCQREVDVLGLRWKELDRLMLVQGKGKRRAYFGLSPELKAALALVPRSHEQVVIFERTGRPFNEHTFRHEAAEIRELAGLPDELKIGDLRRSGSDETTTAGATGPEARAMTGHASEQVFSKHYDVESAFKAKRGHNKRMRHRKKLRAALERSRQADEVSRQPGPE